MISRRQFLKDVGAVLVMPFVLPLFPNFSGLDSSSQTVRRKVAALDLVIFGRDDFGGETDLSTGEFHPETIECILRHCFSKSTRELERWYDWIQKVWFIGKAYTPGRMIGGGRHALICIYGEECPDFIEQIPVVSKEQIIQERIVTQAKELAYAETRDIMPSNESVEKQIRFLESCIQKWSRVS